MKILHIVLSEYTTIGELNSGFLKIDKELTKNGCILMNSKKNAEENLKYQFENNLGSRVFWWEKANFEGAITFILNEAIFD
jgi:hypothetical protein